MFDVRLPNLRWLEERGSMDSILNADPINEQGLILFYGSSSFTRWKPYWKHRPLEEDIRMKDGSRAAVNHGFGTSTSEELLYYYPRLVKPWNPRALVVYCHGNDLAAGYSAQEIMFLQSRLLEWARKDFPGIRFYLETGKPSPSARHSLPPPVCAHWSMNSCCAPTVPTTMTRPSLTTPGFPTCGRMATWATTIIPERNCTWKTVSTSIRTAIMCTVTSICVSWMIFYKRSFNCTCYHQRRAGHA